MTISHRAVDALITVSAMDKPLKVVPLSCYCRLEDLIPRIKQLTQPAPPPKDGAAKAA